MQGQVQSWIVLWTACVLYLRDPIRGCIYKINANHPVLICKFEQLVGKRAKALYSRGQDDQISGTQILRYEHNI